ncbi:MAG TPA: class I SAM-dependent methyltransferase [Tepidisphaeraceae bacterium]|jgi:ubiquinone/menaquinone biosynthesis C-methylase UbiE
MPQYRAHPAYYDAEYASTKMLHQDVPFFLDHLPKKPQRILEIATGTARAAIPLAQAGHRVTGIDIDARMLKLARHKRDAVGLTERQLTLIKADALKFNLNQQFDWICIFFNTFLAFTTLDQQDRFLANVTRHLKPRGQFWLDIFHPDLARLAKRKSRNVEPHLFHVPALDRTVFSWTDIDQNPAQQTQRVTFHYKWFNEQGVEQHEKNTFNLTYLFPRELQLLLDRHNLKLLKLYGNYDGSPLQPDSPRMIAWCTI